MISKLIDFVEASNKTKSRILLKYLLLFFFSFSKYNIFKGTYFLSKF